MQIVLKYTPGDSPNVVQRDIDVILRQVKHALVAEIKETKTPVYLVLTLTKE